MARNRIEALYLHAHRQFALRIVIDNLVGQGAAQFIHQARTPPLGFQDRHAGIALAHDDLRAIDLGRYGEHFNLDIRGAA
ncbi:hypothetical protein D3C84_1187420 [compost metagenome]